LKEHQKQFIVDRAYSNNIYREMTIDDLRREYEKTVLEVNDYKDLVYHELIKEGD
jgi:hypothetical protein